MSKQEQFLWVVQTMVLANAINMASNADWAEKYRIEISTSGAFIAMDEALRASERIPEDLSAAEAANEFCTFMCGNLRESAEKAASQTLRVPSWFAR